MSVVVGLAFVALAAVQWAFVLRPRVVANGAGLAIRGYKSSTQIAWQDIVACRPSRTGLDITLGKWQTAVRSIPAEASDLFGTHDGG